MNKLSLSKKSFTLLTIALLAVSGFFVFSAVPAGATTEPTKPTVPMAITEVLPTFVENISATFTVGDIANDDLGKMVRVHFTIPTGATIEYQEGGADTWIPLENVFGPADGFPLSNITTTLRGTFTTAGTYPVLVEYRFVDSD